MDDSAFMCKVLQEIINSDPQLEVAGQARDGRDAVALAESLRPDVITMDINMPHVDGLQATEMIMSQHPRPIVIVSSESREGASGTLRALELGAIDFVPKPSSGIDLDHAQCSRRTDSQIKNGCKGSRCAHSHARESFACLSASSGEREIPHQCACATKRRENSRSLLSPRLPAGPPQ